jgi:hypothetical protein
MFCIWFQTSQICLNPNLVAHLRKSDSASGNIAFGRLEFRHGDRTRWDDVRATNERDNDSEAKDFLLQV